MNEQQLVQLVRKILAEELEKLSGKEKHALLNGRKEKALFIVPPDLFSFGVFYNHLQQNYNDYQIHIAAENAQTLYGAFQSSNTKYIDLNDAEEKATLYANMLGYAEVFVLMSCPKAAKEIVELNGDCFVAQMVFYTLSQNQSVNALWSFAKESPVSKEIRIYQKKLELMGVRSINIQEFNQNLKEEVRKAEGVVTEQMVMNVHRHGGKEIQTTQDQAVTPLAKDRARELGIHITRFKG